VELTVLAEGGLNWMKLKINSILLIEEDISPRGKI
jgi:hypothetical protein